MAQKGFIYGQLQVIVLKKYKGIELVGRKIKPAGISRNHETVKNPLMCKYVIVDKCSVCNIVVYVRRGEG